MKALQKLDQQSDLNLFIGKDHEADGNAKKKIQAYLYIHLIVKQTVTHSGNVAMSQGKNAGCCSSQHDLVKRRLRRRGGPGHGYIVKLRSADLLFYS
jgi:hypothetical protein